ncbi:related to Cytochrome P450 [Melanopsichium pennsylvanicum]|uniref:Related to Cytochrome P450 n=2 Tax=Melanopsichium pennsylvanicum TaxID=63383 RepID=A0AAJ5C7U5_9BASI|nr:related to Cytochrome P450 [Melanopsichium pennsylvanicum 4]SNX86849.1 related to Cytochrome P450 [Melanopsichium pennsylvanicum]
MQYKLTSNSLWSESTLALLYQRHAPTTVLGTIGFSIGTAFAFLTLFIVFSMLRMLYRTTIYHYYISPLKHLPGPKPKPIVGNMDVFLGLPGAGAEIKWSREHGKDGVFRSTFIFGREAIHFMRPKALRQILVEDPYSYPKPAMAWRLLGLIAGYGLLTVEGDTHRKMRKTMNPAFSLTNLIEQFPVYYAKIYPMVEIMKKQVQESSSASAVIDCDVWVNRALLDIICLTAFGYDADSVHNPENELAKGYHLVTSMQNGKNQGRLNLVLNLPFGDTILDWASDKSGWDWVLKRCKPGSVGQTYFQLLNGMHRIKKVSKEILYKQLNSGERAAQVGSFKAIIDIIEETHLSENDGKPKTLKQAEQDMITQVLTFLGAGHETTASGVSWTLWNLATHPEIQDKLRKECKELMDQDEQPPYSAVKGLVYLDAVINESMRVTPPVPRTVRMASKASYIDGIYIPKDTILPISNRAINMDPEIWGADADQFRPERWFDLPEKYDKTFSMITFIAGAHACIGKTMSYLEMKATICIMVSNFKFEPVSKEQSPVMDTLITMKPQGGLPLKVSLV